MFPGRSLLVGGQLPASAEGAVEGDDAEEFLEACLGEADFGGEEFLFVVEDFEVAGDAALVADRGEVGGLAIGLGAEFLAGTEFAGSLVGDEAIGDFAEGVLDGFLVEGEGFLEAGLGELEVAAEGAAGEEGQGDAGSELPGLAGAGEEVREGDGLEAVEAGEVDARIEGGFGLADVGVGGDEGLFGGAEVGAAVEEVGGQARRDRDVEVLAEEAWAALDGPWVAA